MSIKDLLNKLDSQSNSAIYPYKVDDYFKIDDFHKKSIPSHETWVLNEDDLLYFVHPKFSCKGKNCTLHYPTNHVMRNFRLEFDSEVSIFYRKCEHGYHIDRDALVIDNVEYRKCPQCGCCDCY